MNHDQVHSFLLKLVIVSGSFTHDLPLIDKLHYLLWKVSGKLRPYQCPLSEQKRGVHKNRWLGTALVSKWSQSVSHKTQAKKISPKWLIFFFNRLVAMTGLEPVTPALWMLCSNQLSYIAIFSRVPLERSVNLHADMGCVKPSFTEFSWKHDALGSSIGSVSLFSVNWLCLIDFLLVKLAWLLVFSLILRYLIYRL